MLGGYWLICSLCTETSMHGIGCHLSIRIIAGALIFRLAYVPLGVSLDYTWKITAPTPEACHNQSSPILIPYID